MSGTRRRALARSWFALTLGLAAVVHAVYLLPAAALAVWLGSRRLALAALFLAAVAAAVAPLTLSNVLVGGQNVLISWNGGINLYVGNQPAFDQYSGNRTNAWVRILESPIDAGITSESERDRQYASRAQHHSEAETELVERRHECDDDDGVGDDSA